MPVRLKVSPLESVTVPLVPVPVCPDVTVTSGAENIDEIGRRCRCCRH